MMAKKDRREGLRKARRVAMAKHFEDEGKMRVVWATAGGFLLGAVYGPRLLRLASRSDLAPLVTKVLQAGIPEPWPQAVGGIPSDPPPQGPAKAKRRRS